MYIHGEKVLLRALEPADNEMLMRLINDPEVENMCAGRSFPVSAEQQAQWLARQNANAGVLRCAITLPEQPEPAMGTVMLTDIDQFNGTVQVHYKLLKEYGGKGYATDAVAAVTRYAFDTLRMNCVYAEVLEYNQASRRVLEKCGYTMDAILRSRVYKNGSYWNVCIYSRLRDDA